MTGMTEQTHSFAFVDGDMYQYQHCQTSFKSGEIGEGISEQRGLQIYHSSLSVAQNANVNITGNIYNRKGFSYVTGAPVTDAFYHYDATVWSFRAAGNLGERNIVRRAIIFSENLATVYNVTQNEKLGDLLCTFNTGKPAVVMQQTHYVPIERGDGDYSTKAILFTNRKLKPFILSYKNEASQAQDFKIETVPLYNIPKHDFSNGANDKTGTELGTGNLNIVQKNSQYNVVATNDAFTTGLCADYAGLIVRLKPIGELRVIRRLNAKTLECQLTQDLGNAEQIRAEDFTLALGYEPIASDTRGWFECSAIFQNRLFLANTYDLPNALIGSTTQFKFDFDLGSMQDDDGCYTLVDTHLVDEIVKLQRGSSLHIFSKNQMFVLSSGANTVTPLSVGTTQISQGGGSDTYTQTPQTQAGGIVCIDSKIQKLFYISYDRASETYLPNVLNVIMPNGMVTQAAETWSFVVINYGMDEGECAFFINRNYQIVRVMLTFGENETPCFTHYQFSDELIPLKLFNIGKNLYCIFRKPVTNECFIAVLDDNVYLDCAVDVAIQDKGQGVLPVNFPAFTNGYLIDKTTGGGMPYKVPSDGHIELDEAYEGHTVQIGVPYTFLAITHELEGVPQNVLNTQGYVKMLNWLYISIKKATRLYVGCSDNQEDAEFQYHLTCNASFKKPRTEPIKANNFDGYMNEPILYFKQEVPGDVFIKSYTAQLTAFTPFEAKV